MHLRAVWQSTTGRTPAGAQQRTGRFIRPKRASSMNINREWVGIVNAGGRQKRWEVPLNASWRSGVSLRMTWHWDHLPPAVTLKDPVQRRGVGGLPAAPLHLGGRDQLSFTRGALSNCATNSASSSMLRTPPRRPPQPSVDSVRLPRLRVGMRPWLGAVATPAHKAVERRPNRTCDKQVGQEPCDPHAV